MINHQAGSKGRSWNGVLAVLVCSGGYILVCLGMPFYHCFLHILISPISTLPSCTRWFFLVFATLFSGGSVACSRSYRVNGCVHSSAVRKTLVPARTSQQSCGGTSKHLSCKYVGWRKKRAHRQISRRLRVDILFGRP